MLQTWRQRVQQLKTETYALYLAYKHPGVRWPARVFIACVVAYALSPIDLIPDPIPVLGYLDDLILIPLGIRLALKMIPPDVIAECRERAQATLGQSRRASWVAAVVIVLIWIMLAVWLITLLTRSG